MASGNVVGLISKVMQSGTLYAPEDVRVGGSTPAEQIHLYKYDDATIQYLDYECYLAGYANGGLSIELQWSSVDQTSGAVQWEIGIRAIPDDAENIDDSHTYLFNLISDTTADVAGELSYPVITFTNGADMDNWVNGQKAIVRVRRNTGGTDTLSGFAQLWDIVVKET